jgi:hypothetical protein
MIYYSINNLQHVMKDDGTGVRESVPPDATESNSLGSDRTDGEDGSVAAAAAASPLAA